MEGYLTKGQATKLLMMLHGWATRRRGAFYRAICPGLRLAAELTSGAPPSVLALEVRIAVEAGWGLLARRTDGRDQ